MSTEKLREIFSRHVISRFGDLKLPAKISWFLSAPPLPTTFGGYTTSRIYEKLPVPIRESIHDMLQIVIDDFSRRLQECITADYGTLLHCVLENWIAYVSDLISNISAIC
jgi:hypothetical protein